MFNVHLSQCFVSKKFQYLTGDSVHAGGGLFNMLYLFFKNVLMFFYGYVHVLYIFWYTLCSC